MFVQSLPNREDSRRLASTLLSIARENGVDIPQISTRRMKRLPSAVLARYARTAMVAKAERRQVARIVAARDGAVIFKIGGAY